MPNPLVMGILNVTPDSFSDGGLYLDSSAAIQAGQRMFEEGAGIVDVGGESTRPGAEEVAEAEELRRVLPVVSALASHGAVSIDTMKPGVAREALRAGATMVNDVTSLGAPEMAEVCAEAGCTVCLMHMQGTPRTMQASPNYGDVVREVRDYLVARAERAERRGISREKIWIDPGIGFGKAIEHNLALLNHLEVLVATGFPVVVGVSRKSFIGRVLGGLPVEDRLEGTLATQVVAQLAGVAVIRAHDVLATKRAIEMARAIVDAG